MKIETTAEALASALRGNVAERKSTIPVLEYAQVLGNRIITSNLDLHCIAELDAKFEGEPNFLIPRRQVENLLEDQTGPLTLEYQPAGDPNDEKALKTSRVKLSHDGGEFIFECCNSGNFPVIPQPPLLTMELDGAGFKKTIDRSLFSILNEQSRYKLDGALLEGDGKKATMVATDGHRMSIVEMDADIPIPQGVILPRAALKWMSENIDGDVSLGLGEELHAVKTGKKTLQFRKMNGQFPDWEVVLPKADKISMSVTFPSVKKLRQALSLVAQCADERSGGVTWRFGEESTIEAKSVERGSASFPIDCVATGEMKLRWNAGYILDLLNIVEDGSAVVDLQDDQSSCLWHLDGMKYIVMPMRI